jgi:hypothetical protein
MTTLSKSQATLAPDVEKTHLLGKKYESLLPSSSAIHLFSRGYSGTTVAIIPLRRRLFQAGEADRAAKNSWGKIRPDFNAQRSDCAGFRGVASKS